MRTIDWAAHGVELVHPEAPVAHALAQDRAVGARVADGGDGSALQQPEAVVAVEGPLDVLGRPERLAGAGRQVGEAVAP